MSPSEDQLHDRFKYSEYLREFVYGGIDGSVTTFAVVAGAAGAGLSSGVVIILGIANLIADGFSMSVGSYLSAGSEREHYEKQRRREYWEIEHLRESEVQEIRDIYAGYGLQGEVLDKVVETITADKDRWVDVMMKEELEMTRDPKPPLASAVATFIAFVLFGAVPLLTYVLAYMGWEFGDLFLITSVLTGAIFVVIGLLKARVNHANMFRSILETLLLGAAAASLAYFAGELLRTWINI